MRRRFVTITNFFCNTRPPHQCIYCRVCRTRVAYVWDFVAIGPDGHGIFTRVFNVHVSDEERYHRQVNGGTLADTHCVRCGNLLGFKLVAVPQPSMYIREGRFVLKLYKLSNWNNQLLPHRNEEQVGGANEQNDDDEDGGAPMN